LGLLLWLSLFFYLFSAASPAHAQTPSERLASIERELTFSLATCGKLSNELIAQSGRLASLSADLQALRDSFPIYEQRLSDLESELLASQQLSADLLGEISRLRDLLATSQQRLAELSETFERYRAAQAKVVLGLERQVVGWKVAAVVLGALAAGLGVWAAVK